MAMPIQKSEKRTAETMAKTAVEMAKEANRTRGRKEKRTWETMKAYSAERDSQFMCSSHSIPGLSVATYEKNGPFRGE